MADRITRGRNPLALLLATTLVVLGVAASSASAATTTFSNATPIVIPDSGTATPYPSTINAAGFAGNVQKATVTLHGFTHTCPEDLSVLLTGPSGAKSILMGEVGGCPQDATEPQIELTFDQAAASGLDAIPDSGYPVSGTYKPSESSPTASLSPPAPGGPYPVNLGEFNGKPANGAWNLFIEDCCPVDQGSVTRGWSLTLTAPVNTVKAGKPKLNKKKGTAKVPVTVGDAGTVILRGKGIKTRSAFFGGPGSGKLTVKPKGKTSRKLNSTGKATVKAKITFTPNGGASKTVKKKIKLKKS